MLKGSDDGKAMNSTARRVMMMVNKRKPTGGSLHAHWDCSKGISGTSMMAAILGAVRDPRIQQTWMDELQTVLPLLFPGALKRCRIHFETSGHKFPHVQYECQMDDSQEWNWTLLMHLLLPEKQQQNQNDSDQDDDSEDENGLVSPWVLHCTMACLNKLQEAEKRIGCPALPSFQYIESAVVVLGTLWSMNRLGIGTVSCSPLPWTPNTDWNSSNNNAGDTTDSQTTDFRSTQRTPQMLLGMPISSGSSTCTSSDPLVTDTAVAMLVILTQQASAGGCAVGKIPPMTLRAMSSGYDQVPFQERKVSLLLGILMSDSDGNGDNSNVSGGGGNSLAMQSEDWKTERMHLLEANLDDTTPEHLAFCVEWLLTQGAADAWVTPIIMKKGRPSHTLHCLCLMTKTKAMLHIFYQHSTTLGVRVQTIDRAALPRTTVAVDITAEDWRNMMTTTTVQDDAAVAATTAKPPRRKVTVDVKMGLLGDTVTSAKAEFEHCKAASLETGVPIQSIADTAVRKAREQQQNKGE